MQCPYTQVIQYDPENKEWVELGDMIAPRELHTVVEVFTRLVMFRQCMTIAYSG